jgi:hypothetical protein
VTAVALPDSPNFFPALRLWFSKIVQYVAMHGVICLEFIFVHGTISFVHLGVPSQKFENVRTPEPDVLVEFFESLFVSTMYSVVLFLFKNEQEHK